MEDDWDLYAVVRGCAASTTATTSSSATPTSYTQPSNNFHQDWDFSSSAACFQGLFEPRRESFVQELHDLYKPFFPKPQQQRQQPSQTTPLSPQSIPISPLSVLGGLQDLSSDQQIIKQLPPQTTQFREKQPLFSIANVSKAGSSHNPGPRPKRRKNHMKKLCHVAAENLSSDIWSWRKYGQKPIKGSPYPRGYYRCSTSKGCMARKQVERNRSDPGMFIVTYTAEHNHPVPTHRNSLAGSTRQKAAENPNSDEPSKQTESPAMSPAESLSPAPEKLESSREDLAEEEDDEFSVSNPELDDDFFAGLEDLATPAVQQSFPFPLLSNSATTTAAGGGS